jgi:hypothetical protein
MNLWIVGVSYISMYAYVMHSWMKVPIMISFQRVVDGRKVENFILVIMKALHNGGGLSLTFVAQKFLCFGGSWVNAFQGTKIGVTKQINTNNAPCSIGLHYTTHRWNLAFKTLSSLRIVNTIECLLQSYHSYFIHSPKKHLEFIKLINPVETKGLKMFLKVKTL